MEEEDRLVISVKWDQGSNLSLIDGYDKFEILD
jgi:hypothetical protein